MFSAVADATRWFRTPMIPALKGGAKFIATLRVEYD
jgi:hypothetical protein